MYSVHEKIANIIIEKLRKGIVPWREKWTSSWPPRNLISKKPYRGINLLLLSGLKYELPYFLTFKQVKYLKGSVIKGEKAHFAVSFRKTKSNAQSRVNFELQFYHVFNISQCKGIASKHIPWQINGGFNPITEAKHITSNMPNPPKINFSSHKPCYIPDKDRINMPQINSFKSEEELYATLFHEMIHSTGHCSRLGRKSINRIAAFASNVFTWEELVAELGTAFLCGEAGISNLAGNNSSEYIQGWISRIMNDKTMIVFAANAAQKACDYILNRKKMETDNGWRTII